MVNDLTTCRVMNKHDDTFMTLCTEWLKDSDSSFKITVLLDSDSSSLNGEMKLNEVESFAKNLSKTRTEYLDLTRSVLSGKEDSGIDFILKDSKLRWKKGPWNHGMIGVSPTPFNRVFPQLMEKLLTRDRELETKVDELKKENEELKNERRETDNKLEELIDLKNRQDDDLYKRFIVVLNLKKERIRQLEYEIRNLIATQKKQSVYEIQTDESEASEKDEKEEVGELKTQGGMNATNVLSRISGFGGSMLEEKLLKRQISDSDGKMTDSDYEDDKKAKENCVKPSNNTKKIKNYRELSKPSTSKNNKENKSSRISLSTPSVSRLRLSSEESEEDIFS